MIVLGFAFVLLTQVQSGPADAFRYDITAPLEFTEELLETVAGVRLMDVSYASPHGGRVPAYLLVPAGKGPFPAIVFMHEGGADRTQFISEGLALGNRGVTSIMIDAPYRRPEVSPAPQNDTRGRAESDRDLYVQLVVDLRRAVDLLAARTDVDIARIGYVGHSLGAAWGGVLAGIEPRIKAFVFIAGVPNPGMVSGDDPYSRLMQTVLSTDERALEHYDALVGAIAAHHFVGHARPGSLLFQFGRYDRNVSKARADEFPLVAGPSHEVRWYPTGHRFFDEQATADRREWLAKKLSF
jgi:dienelactone hydrolase